MVVYMMACYMSAGVQLEESAFGVWQEKMMMIPAPTPIPLTCQGVLLSQRVAPTGISDRVGLDGLQQHWNMMGVLAPVFRFGHVGRRN